MNESDSLITTTGEAIRSKRRKFGGKPPQITEAMIDRIVERQRSGLKIRQAIAQENPHVPYSHWEKTLATRARLRAYAEQKAGAVIEGLLLELRAAPPGQWQKLAWILERCFDYSAPKTGSGQVNVMVTNVIGLSDDISKRSAQLLADAGKPRPALFNRPALPDAG